MAVTSIQATGLAAVDGASHLLALAAGNLLALAAGHLLALAAGILAVLPLISLTQLTAHRACSGFWTWLASGHPAGNSAGPETEAVADAKTAQQAVINPLRLGNGA